jgi:hypothetical protein
LRIHSVDRPVNLDGVRDAPSRRGSARAFVPRDANKGASSAHPVFAEPAQLWAGFLAIKHRLRRQRRGVPTAGAGFLKGLIGSPEGELMQMSTQRLA